MRCLARCDRIVYKSTVLPPQPPPTLPVPNLPGSLSDALHEDSRFGRVGNLLTGIRRGSKIRKDSLSNSGGTLPLPRSKEHSSGTLSRGGSLRIKESGSSSRPCSNLLRGKEVQSSGAGPLVKQAEGDGDDSGIVLTNGETSRPGSAGKAARPGGAVKRPGSAGSAGVSHVDQPASSHWPRTNPFARLLHPHLHTPGGPGLIHAVSMEPVPQPSADVTPIPRPRSFSTSEGREKSRDRAGSDPRPPRQSNSEDAEGHTVQTPRDDGIWRFFRSFRDQPTVVAEPEPEPEPVQETKTRRRGDIVCVSYGTLDDREMQRLGGRSDHRPVIGARLNEYPEFDTDRMRQGPTLCIFNLLTVDKLLEHLV